ncbi:MAG: hypothetical protein WAM14_21940 [Candidatus Nitrosopolaris sp.]
MIINRGVLITLVLISALGVIAIPFGDPKFINEAIALEFSFVALAILIWKGYTKPLYACIALAIAIIIGNSTSSAHVHLMTTFSKPVNALILIIGGYVLEGVLIYTSLKSIISIRSKSLTKSKRII